MKTNKPTEAEFVGPFTMEDFVIRDGNDKVVEEDTILALLNAKQESLYPPEFQKLFQAMADNQVSDLRKILINEGWTPPNAKPASPAKPVDIKAVMKSIHRKSFVVSAQDYGKEVIFPDWVQEILKRALGVNLD